MQSNNMITIINLALASMAIASPIQQPSYTDSIAALVAGKVSTNNEATGTVWMNLTGIAPTKLPHIQQNLGVYSMGNQEIMKNIADLAKTAATDGKYGDLVYLYNAFDLNAHDAYLLVTSKEMQEGLAKAVTNTNSTVVDDRLVELYASTSSIPALAAAYRNAQPHASSKRDLELHSLNKKWSGRICAADHQASYQSCRNLIDSVSKDGSIKVGGPRAICQSGCCISWSRDANFNVWNLKNAANDCMNCAGTGVFTAVSCKEIGVDLQGTVVNQCLSNRAKGCT